MAQYIAVRALNRSSNVRVIQVNNEVQTLTVAATAGQIKLTFEGQQTIDIAVTATAATVQTQLIALSNIGPDDVVVTGGPGDANGTTPYVITFRGALGDRDVGTITVADGTTPASGGLDTQTVAVTSPGINGGRPVKLSTTVDTLIDVDRVTNRRALARHSAIGQWIVTAANAFDGTVALPTNT